MRPNGYVKEELSEIYDATVDFVANEVTPVADLWEEQGQVPRSIVRQMGDLGMLGLRVPEKFGGMGLGPLASAVFSEALGTSTYGGFDVTILVHTDMSTPHLINAGTDEQKAEFFPKILTGETIVSIGVTEPDAGSDVAGIRTKAIKDGDGWVINGNKTYITNAVYGDMTIIAARTNPEHKYGISMFMVDNDTEGFEVTKKLNKTGWLCSDTAELNLQDVWVPAERMLGEEHRGFYAIMENFQTERMVLIGMGLGAAQTAIDITVEHAKARAAFGGKLFDLGTIRQRMGLAQAKVDAVRSSMYHAAWLEEQGIDNVREMSGVKAFGAEVINQVMYECVQFHGGLGYMRESAIERMSRDARILPIGGGATEVMLEEVAKRL